MAKLTALLVLPLSLAACGGGSAPGSGGGLTVAPPIVPPAIAQPGAPTPESTGPAEQQPVVLPRTAARPLPTVPLNDEKDPADFTDGKHVVLGSRPLDYSQCEISGAAMKLNPGGLAVRNQNALPTWALYRVSGLTDGTPLSLNGELLPDGYAMSYRIAVADYGTQDWVWLGPVTFPEYQFDLTGDHRFISDEGNLHFMIVCDGANSAVHYRSTVVLSDSGNSGQPSGPAYRLYGSVFYTGGPDPASDDGKPGTDAGGAGGDSEDDQYSLLVRLLDPETEDIASAEYNGGGTTRPLSGVLMQLLNSVGAVQQATWTDADGGYEFTRVSAGDYQVVAQLYGWSFQPAARRFNLPTAWDKADAEQRLDFLALPDSAN